MDWLPRCPGSDAVALAATNATQKADPSSHKVLSCNVRVDVPADGKAGNGWADRKDLCAEVMRAQQADLICLQECQHVHLKHLKTRLPEFDSFALSNPDGAAHPLNAILYSRGRYALVSTGGFWLSEDAPSGRARSRGIPTSRGS